MTQSVAPDASLSWPIRTRRWLRQFPILGPLAYRVWLRVVRGEGKVLTIEDGPLKGLKLRQVMGLTTVVPELTTGKYEVACLQRLKSELRSGSVFFDVGTHTGIFAMFGARIVGNSGRVLAVEAHPINAHHARNAMLLNDITNCEVVSVAASDHVGSSVLIDPGNSSMFQLAEVSTDAMDSRMKVPTTTLEVLAQQHGDPDVIKMDIEGAELLALKGAEPLLRRKKPALLVEVHSAEIALSLHAFLRQVGYQITDLDGCVVPEARWERFIVAK